MCSPATRTARHGRQSRAHPLCRRPASRRRAADRPGAASTGVPGHARGGPADASADSPLQRTGFPRTRLTGRCRDDGPATMRGAGNNGHVTEAPACAQCCRRTSEREHRGRRRPPPPRRCGHRRRSGTLVPYLRSVADPYDKLSPYHDWPRTLTDAEAERRLAPVLAGRLVDTAATARTASGRAATVPVTETVGTRDL